MAKKKIKYQPKQPESFADGLNMFFTPGSMLVPVRLTKARCRIIMEIIKEHQYETARYEEEGGEQYADDWCAVMQWLSNQVYKRYSQAQLYTD